ncbi:MFS transporter [Streptomyces hoynatensis]|uniref:DHA2 family efflux MFS transporter permease subunit n=1 Tax=Streptomyces hoynatensis TaxID=1141874 RepID=A0A3A9ZEX2_9ACTN|nr:MFS transporter [Streptomyces hoynatensis]RKN46735.1 DHA2 family efflux MFS transporter permease subunit [Streptomyces hoynatensis]
MEAPPAPGRAVIVWTLVLTGAATFMTALDNLVVTTALPAIREDLDSGVGQLEWIVNGYTLPFACLLLPAAALGDRYGRRRLFALGVALFTAASAASALAGSTEMLIAGRALQGAGAALVFPLSLTLISATVPAERRGAAFGVWGAINGLAVAGGPLIGGIIVEHISWQWIFWVNVPLGLLLLPLIPLRLAESRVPGARLDPLGAVLAGSGMLGVLLGIVRGNDHGWTSAGVVGSFVAGGALLGAFLAWQLRARAPMVPLRLFRSRQFSASIGAGLLMSAGMFGSIFLLTQFLQLIQGYSPQEAGLRMLPWTAMPMVVTPLMGALSDRIGGRSIAAVGMLLMACGLGWFALLAEPDVGYPEQVPAFVLCGVGMAMFFAATGPLVMGSVGEREQGIASGVSNAMRELGASLGVAVLAAVFAANGGYESPDAFTDGLVPAVWGGAFTLLVATVVMLIAPRAHRAPRATGRPVAGSAPEPERAPAAR